MGKPFSLLKPIQSHLNNVHVANAEHALECCKIYKARAAESNGREAEHFNKLADEHTRHAEKCVGLAKEAAGFRGDEVDTHSDEHGVPADKVDFPFGMRAGEMTGTRFGMAATGANLSKVSVPAKTTDDEITEQLGEAILSSTR